MAPEVSVLLYFALGLLVVAPSAMYVRTRWFVDSKDSYLYSTSIEVMYGTMIGLFWPIAIAASVAILPAYFVVRNTKTQSTRNELERKKLKKQEEDLRRAELELEKFARENDIPFDVVKHFSGS